MNHILIRAILVGLLLSWAFFSSRSFARSSSQVAGEIHYAKQRIEWHMSVIASTQRWAEYLQKHAPSIYREKRAERENYVRENQQKIAELQKRIAELEIELAAARENEARREQAMRWQQQQELRQRQEYSRVQDEAARRKRASDQREEWDQANASQQKNLQARLQEIADRQKRVEAALTPYLVAPASSIYWAGSAPNAQNPQVPIAPTVEKNTTVVSPSIPSRGIVPEPELAQLQGLWVSDERKRSETDTQRQIGASSESRRLVQAVSKMASDAKPVADQTVFRIANELFGQISQGEMPDVAEASRRGIQAEVKSLFSETRQAIVESAIDQLPRDRQMELRAWRIPAAWTTLNFGEIKSAYDEFVHQEIVDRMRELTADL